MITLEELREAGIRFLRLYNDDVITRIGRDRLVSAVENAVDFIEGALHYLGADVCEAGELDCAALALMWFSIMFETSSAIVIDARSTDDGFMLCATIALGTKLERDGETATARKTFYTRQLFFYDDTRSLQQARELCRNRAAELVDAVFEGDTGDN